MVSRRQNTSSEALTLTIIAALLRLVPHPPNFAPIGGISLLSGAKISGWQAYFIPVLAMAVTDPILSYMTGYPAFSSGTLIIYACFLINVWLGRMFLQGSSSPIRIATVATAGSLQFFAITNLAVWWQASSLYPHTVAGLLNCYVAALPFLERTLAGDLFYSGVLFTVYHQLGKRTLSLASTTR